MVCARAEGGGTPAQAAVATEEVSGAEGGGTPSPAAVAAEEVGGDVRGGTPSPAAGAYAYHRCKSRA